MKLNFFILFLLFNSLCIAQSNCPVFPKAKKPQHFRKSIPHYTYLGLNSQVFSVYKLNDPSNFNSLIGFQLGVTHIIKNRFVFQAGLGAGPTKHKKGGDYKSYGMGKIEFDYLFNFGAQHFGIGICANSFENEENGTFLPSINLNYFKTNKKGIKNIYFGFYPTKTYAFLLLGASIGIRVR